MSRVTLSESAEQARRLYDRGCYFVYVKGQSANTN